MAPLTRNPAGSRGAGEVRPSRRRSRRQAITPRGEKMNPELELAVSPELERKWVPSRAQRCLGQAVIPSQRHRGRGEGNEDGCDRERFRRVILR